MPFIYLDNSTTTKPSEKAISRMLPFFTDSWGVPSAPHQKGQELFHAMGESYKILYSFLGAKEEDHFVLTSSGAEAVNHVIHAAYREMTLQTGKNQFLTSACAEAPSIMAMERLDPLGCISKLIDVDTNGNITAETLAGAISPRTALVSISWANGLTGVIQPLQPIAELCKQRGILLHIDATHVLGKLFCENEEIQAQYISFNGDHLHAPKGTGGLLIKQGVKCPPFIAGGSDQGGLRAGPMNVPSLAALAAAAHEAIDSRDYVCTEIARLRNKLESGIVQGYPEAKILFGDQERIPTCACIAFPGIVNEALLYALNKKNVYASIGGGNLQQLTLMLAAIGVDPSLAQSAVSFSLSRYTTEEEIDRAIEIITEAALSLLKITESL